MGGKQRRVQATAGDQPHQLGNRVGVDQPRRDRDVTSPQLLQVQRRGLAMHADVRHASTGADQLGRELERVRHADRLQGDIGAEAVGELHDLRNRVLAPVVDRRVGAEPLGAFQPAVVEVDRDDPPGRIEARGENRRKSDRPGADDCHDIARCDLAVEHTNLEGGRQDVGEEQNLLVRELLGDLVDGVIGERNACILRLQTVDQMAEDPATTAETLPVASFLAVATAPAGADARHQHPVADGDRAHARADLLHGADRLVAEHRAGGRLGHIALEDVQV